MIGFAQIADWMFFKHPREHGMTYKGHAARSIYFGITLGLASVQAFVHALIPAFFTNSTTDIAKELKESVL